jgi:hypothetical protein
MNRFLLAYLLLLAVCQVLAQNSPQQPQAKEALLIANGDYAHFGKLPNPISDERLLGRALEKVGFHVAFVENASREGMLDALQAFQDRLKTSHGIALFHYGGHGVQVNGRNYLIPVDADIPDERKVSTRAVDLEEVMTTLDGSGSEVNVVVLDACRDNPLPATSSRSASRGLLVVQTKPKNSLIVYAAEPGSKAEDGLFTPSLADAITSPGKSLSQIFKEVRKDVYQKSAGSQTPGEYDQLFEDVYLTGGNTLPPPQQATSQIQNVSLQPSPLNPGYGERTTNVSMPSSGHSPQEVVFDYYRDLNQGNFTSAWNALPAGLQQNSKIHPNGYASFKSWFQGITPIAISKSSVVEEGPNDATVDIQCTFNWNGRNSPQSLRYGLTRDNALNRWEISSVKINKSGSDAKFYVTGLDPNGDNWLALKSAPDLKSGRLRKLAPDTPLTLLSRNGSWMQVRLDDGAEGWVYSKYVKPR